MTAQRPAPLGRPRRRPARPRRLACVPALLLAVGAASAAIATGEGGTAEGQAAPAPAADGGPLAGAAAGAPPVAEPIAGPIAQPATGPITGPITGLPIPRYVSLRASEARARRGPSLDHAVDWVYRRRGLPLRVTAEHGHWRRVEDAEGQGGWVHYSLISGRRMALVVGGPPGADEATVTLVRRPRADATVEAMLEPGVVAKLGPCEGAWCRLQVEGHRGWATRDALWGDDG